MAIQHEIVLSLAGDLDLKVLVRRYMSTCMRCLSARSVHLHLYLDGIDDVFAAEAKDFQDGRYFAIPRNMPVHPENIDDIRQLLQRWRQQDFRELEPTRIESGDSHYHLFPMSHGAVLILERHKIPLRDSVVQAISPIVEYLQSYCEVALKHGRIVSEVEKRTRAEQRLQHIAYHDDLTGMPNRLYLVEKINEALLAAKQGDWKGALIYIDLDNFRDINDSLGHAVGDQLLQLVGERLANNLTEGEVIARLGGDEFALLVPHLDAHKLSLMAIVESLRDKLKQPFQTPERPLYIAASFGLTVFPGDEEDAVSILRQGDIAMSQVKASGRNDLKFYEPAMDADARARFRLDADMRNALGSDQFQLHLQPQVDQNAQVLGAEVLIRWQHPELGFVSPLDFISIAEKTGFIVPMGQWILHEACRHIALLQQHPETRHWRIAVNISAKQFHQPKFVEMVDSILAQSGVPGSALELELTESTLLDNVEQVIEKMAALRERDIHISIDDFGTGYSSLTYLKRLPVNKLKIDQSFARGVHLSADDSVIVEAIIAMAGRFGLDVIAEGVEDIEDLEHLVELGCDEFQGYYFYRPQPLDQLLESLQLGSS
jgi:diguanylate cyclase (GGDEF)-like protein